MPVQSNKLKANKLKEPKAKPVKKKRKLAGQKGKVKKSSSNGFDPRLKRVIGFFFLLSSMYLFLAFSSFFVNWFDANPVNPVSQSIGNYFSDHAQIVENWTGRFGNWLSHLLVLNGVGVGAFTLSIIFLGLGLKMLLNVRLFKLWPWFQILVLGLLWLPVLFNLIYPDHPDNILGGFVGHQLNFWMHGYLGQIGIIFLLIFIPATFILIDFKFNWKRKKPKADKDLLQDSSSKNKRKEDIYNTVEFSVDEEEEEQKVIKVSDNIPNDDFGIELDSAIPKKTENKKEEKEDDLELTIEETIVEEKVKQALKPGDHFGVDTEFDPRLDLPDFKMPPLDLLVEYDDGNISIDKEELESNKNKIVETLNHYAISITKIKATIGPTVTLYEIVPAPGVRISRIKNLEDDIALSLSAMGIRIIAPIPGKGTVGIEVPNRNPNIVSMRSILSSEKFQNNKYELPIGIGKTIANESFVADLAKMPHILMAGATGQGKSVGLNAIIASLLYSKHPSELKFILVDPKKVELTLYSRIERHYLAKLPDSEEAIITDTRKVVRTLNSLGIEMDNRYELLKDAQVRNIKEYNQKFITRKLNPEHGHRYLPYFVLVVDEFADLILTAGKEVESPITRLAQLARAVGIHLVIATQRPSVNIITGTIKANFPVRIAFRVISKIDSRTILDTGGADQLVGRGDMLMSTGSDLIRLQCAFVDTPEIGEVTSYIGAQRAYPDAYHLPEYVDEEKDAKPDFDINDRDELFEDAALIIVQTQQGSTSLLQRKLKLGYNRAGRIIDQLEAAGIVGAFEGSKAREVKVANEMALEQFLKDLNRNDEDIN
ncbi:MAG: DNA translocase FtsK [Bacteroidetes bacterium]|nr:MAG: DNA translocase FtsK [Bacteroidota bacterium]